MYPQCLCAVHPGYTVVRKTPTMLMQYRNCDPSKSSRCTLLLLEKIAHRIIFSHRIIGGFMYYMLLHVSKWSSCSKLMCDSTAPSQIKHGWWSFCLLNHDILQGRHFTYSSSRQQVMWHQMRYTDIRVGIKLIRYDSTWGTSWNCARNLQAKLTCKYSVCWPHEDWNANLP